MYLKIPKTYIQFLYVCLGLLQCQKTVFCFTTVGIMNNTILFRWKLWMEMCSFPFLWVAPLQRRPRLYQGEFPMEDGTQSQQITIIRYVEYFMLSLYLHIIYVYCNFYVSVFLKTNFSFANRVKESKELKKLQAGCSGPA